MLLTAAITKAELVALATALTPLRIVIDEQRGRAIMLGRPRLELVPDAGIRLRGDARVTWDVAGVNVPVTIKSWQVMLVPRLVDRGKRRVLAFEPAIEELDLKLVPGFLDDKIAHTITDGITQNREKLTWDFARALSHRWPLPRRLGAGGFQLSAVDGGVRVTAEELTLTVRFEASVVRGNEDRMPRSSRRGVVSERRPQIR